MSKKDLEEERLSRFTGIEIREEIAPYFSLMCVVNVIFLFSQSNAFIWGAIL